MIVKLLEDYSDFAKQVMDTETTEFLKVVRDEALQLYDSLHEAESEQQLRTLDLIVSNDELSPYTTTSNELMLLMTYAFAHVCNQHNKLTLDGVRYNGLQVVKHYNQHLTKMSLYVLPQKGIISHDCDLLGQIINNEEDLLHTN